ncbi:RHS repeat domain-containing protein [Victivallis sp. Marseille-Q1083]|uniref:RHS repeat domain-containing protein n=1 Tax=Victivallis sp. Marseille-Q1083 TaxID=2717288 RepID=UPI00158B931E|nr:RHS repeat-associated core domain-containing protein [Victivallis sp. Marseille-Q1083]
MTKNYGYTLNIKDQRIKTTLADGSYWDYAYDNYGQVINAVRKNASGGIAGQSFNYSFDQVGNRLSAFQGTTVSDSQWSYTVNAVNQYSLITEPNGTTYAQVHDADGNLTGSYTTQYTYDAENRLKTADVGTYRYEYTYDYQGRRIKQKVILKSGATGQTQSEVAYVYDGWNVVGVYDNTTATPSFQTGYLWGEDLSGSLQGAGGVGGLLAETRGGQTYLPVYDGNGNIVSYLNASTKASVAEYVYDAFGRTVSSSGAEADNFTYRFSTKPVDGNGLYYYGYRYYDPQHGRWISRDPLEEEGGVNLYGFIQNNGVNYFDFLGMSIWTGTSDRLYGEPVGLGLNPAQQNEVFLGFSTAEIDGNIKGVEMKAPLLKLQVLAYSLKDDGYDPISTEAAMTLVRHKIRFMTYEDLLTQLKEYVELDECRCIDSLIILAHGESDGKLTYGGRQLGLQDDFVALQDFLFQ